MTCPCGTGRATEDCCGRFHGGERPPTAEALMRARFSAFALGKIDFLLATGPAESREDLTAQAASTRWLRLQINGTDAGTARDRVGTVSFEALFEQGGKLGRLVERSRFAREEGGWRYLDGDAHVLKVEAGRNDLCPCGSGKKFKHCHAP
jgi:SEC-C motif-containing protein